MRVICTFTFILIFLNNKQAYGSPPLGARIIGGNVAQSGQFPFVAAIDLFTETSTYFCGGAVLTEEWVLTAGECTYQAVSANVSLGSVSRSADDPNRVTIPASEIVAHPEYDPTTLANDIGLIKLSEPVELGQYVQTIRLATINLPSILTPTAVGWGQTAEEDEDLAAELNYVTLSILSNEECREVYGSVILDSMVCVTGESKGTCYGDSGSPLVVRPIGATSLQVVGVSSFFSGNGCHSDDPSGYTRTYPYLDWIDEVINVQ